MLAMILCTSSSGVAGVEARSGFELLMLLERDSSRLLGLAIALESVAYWMGSSNDAPPTERGRATLSMN